MNNLQCGNNGQGYKDSYDAFHQGEKVGEGVYVTPQPDIMESHFRNKIIK